MKSVGRKLDRLIINRAEGASIYDVRSGWGKGVPKKPTKGTGFVTVTREGKGEKNQKISDVIYGRPLRRLRGRSRGWGTSELLPTVVVVVAAAALALGSSGVD